jgi:hypothetical protein
MRPTNQRAPVALIVRHAGGGGGFAQPDLRPSTVSPPEFATHAIQDGFAGDCDTEQSQNTATYRSTPQVGVNPASVDVANPAIDGATSTPVSVDEPHSELAVAK